MTNKLKQLTKNAIRKVISFAIDERLAPIEAAMLESSRKQQQIQQSLDGLLKSGDIGWLLSNSDERMDANLEIFDHDRRQFHLDRYRLAAGLCDLKRVADIACGTGYGSSILASDGNATEVVGIDLDKDTINYAREHYSGKNCRFLCRDATQTELEDESFDLVVSFETIEHVQRETDLIDEFNRILKKGGGLICSVPNNWALETTPHHEREYDLEQFRKCLSGHFNIEMMYNQNSGKGMFNRGRPRELIETNAKNSEYAECFIAVCKKR